MKKHLISIVGLLAFGFITTVNAQTLCYTPLVDGSGKPVVSGDGGPVVTDTYDCETSEIEVDVIEVTYIYEIVPFKPVDNITKSSIQKATEAVLFDFDEAEIMSSGYKVLNDVANAMKSNKDYNLVIEGHADEKGTEPYNYDLAKERAKNVYRYLVNKGVDPSRLNVRSYGENQPRSTNPKYNRRVEFMVTQ